MSIASRMGVAMIEAYQRHLSPRKGFRCAYGALHGTGTCSSIGKRFMREQGFLRFFKLMPMQFAACKVAATALNLQMKTGAPKKHMPHNANNDACETYACEAAERSWHESDKHPVCETIEFSCLMVEAASTIGDLISACG